MHTQYNRTRWRHSKWDYCWCPPYLFT